MSDLRGMTIGALLAGMLLIPLMCAHDTARDRVQGLRADSLEASRDTTRRLTLAFGILADGAQALQRRAIQAELERDRMDRALGQVRKVNGNLALTVDDLTSLAQTAKHVIESTDSVKFEWAVRQAPFSIDVATKVPRTMADALLDLSARLDPAPLAFRVGCGSPNKANSGLKPASLTVTAPKWLHVSIGDVETDPAVCNPEKHSWWRDRRTWILASAAAIRLTR